MFFPTFTAATEHFRRQLKAHGKWVENATWQGMDVSAKPEMRMRELSFQSFQVPMPYFGFMMAEDIKPNLPWADNHFEERVGGEPINPGVEWANWPWGNSADKFRDENGQFNHNYMERYWPKYAGADTPPFINHGIRFQYGDLNDVVSLLEREPLTRQAFLPVWFPEDTGAKNGRVPCTLGYHFMVRNDHLHVVYYIRSCDLVRHFQDDCYLTTRLALWLLDELRKRDNGWHNVSLGLYMMHISSLHCFANDVPQL